MALVTPQLIEEIRQQVSSDLTRLLNEKFTGEFSVSLHIQAGKMGHIRIADKPEKEPRELLTKRRTQLPGQMENDLISFTHLQLNRILTSDYYGVVTVTLYLAGGDFEMITCGSERTYQCNKPRASTR